MGGRTSARASCSRGCWPRRSKGCSRSRASWTSTESERPVPPRAVLAVACSFSLTLSRLRSWLVGLCLDVSRRYSYAHAARAPHAMWDKTLPRAPAGPRGVHSRSWSWCVARAARCTRCKKGVLLLLKLDVCTPRAGTCLCLMVFHQHIMRRAFIIANSRSPTLHIFRSIITMPSATLIWNSLLSV